MKNLVNRTILEYQRENIIDEATEMYEMGVSSKYSCLKSSLKRYLKENGFKVIYTFEKKTWNSETRREYLNRES